MHFFSVQTWCLRVYKIYLKFFPWISQFVGGISVSFVKIRKVKYLQIFFSNIINRSQNLQENLQEEMRDCKKSNIP